MPKFLRQLKDVSVSSPADGQVLTYDTGGWVNADATGGGGGSQTLVDLGVVNVADLNDGPQTLATPADGSLFYVIPSRDGFVQGDGSIDVAPASRIGASQVSQPLLQMQVGNPYISVVVGSWREAVADGTAVKAVGSTTQSGYPITTTPAAWQANHLYPASLVLILGPDNHLWSQTAGGTSGGTIPDFAANEATANTWQLAHVYASGEHVFGSLPYYVWSASGGTSGGTDPGLTPPGPVTDNDITWTLQTDGDILWADEGAIPTVGSLHLYALTADAA